MTHNQPHNAMIQPNKKRKISDMSTPLRTFNSIFTQNKDLIRANCQLKLENRKLMRTIDTLIKKNHKYKEIITRMMNLIHDTQDSHREEICGDKGGSSDMEIGNTTSDEDDCDNDNDTTVLKKHNEQNTTTKTQNKRIIIEQIDAAQNETVMKRNTNTKFSGKAEPQMCMNRTHIPLQRPMIHSMTAPMGMNRTHIPLQRPMIHSMTAPMGMNGIPQSQMRMTRPMNVNPMMHAIQRANFVNALATTNHITNVNHHYTNSIFPNVSNPQHIPMIPPAPHAIRRGHIVNINPNELRNRYLNRNIADANFRLFNVKHQ
eukprot:578268_1